MRIFECLNLKRFFNKNLGSSQRYTGFTLAEILIVIGIIGVVAGMTIPTLMNNIQNTEMKTAYKKNYSILNQAFSAAITDNASSLKGICADDDNTCVRDFLANKLIVTKKCDAGSVDNQCWPLNWTRLNGGPGWATSATATGLALSDGAFIQFIGYYSNCNNVTGTLLDCGAIGLDINGLKKPNIIGKDIFFLHLMENKISPYGIQNDDVEKRSGDYACGGTGDGEICASDYLYK